MCVDTHKCACARVCTRLFLSLSLPRVPVPLCVSPSPPLPTPLRMSLPFSVSLPRVPLPFWFPYMIPMGPSQTLGVSLPPASRPSQCLFPLSRVPVTISDPLPGKLRHRLRPPQPRPCPLASSSPSRSWSTDTLPQSPPAGKEAAPGTSNPTVTREQPQLGLSGAGRLSHPASPTAQLECSDGVLLCSCLEPTGSFQIEVPATQLSRCEATRTHGSWVSLLVPLAR